VEKVGKKLSDAEWRELRGLCSFQIALAKGDQLACQEAMFLITGERWPELMTGSAEEFAQLATEFLTDSIERVRLVYWLEHKSKQVGVGLYCPDFKTAVAVHLLLAGAFRVCPRCHKTFAVRHPKQMCCSIECREAHRVARWRARQKKGR
jgi:hypothetical protein